jgi:hypothetical protein
MALWRVTLDLARTYSNISRRRVEDNGPEIVFVQNSRKLWEQHCLPVLPILFLKYSPNFDDDERVFAFSTDKGAFRTWGPKQNVVKVSFAV